MMYLIPCIDIIMKVIYFQGFSMKGLGWHISSTPIYSSIFHQNHIIQIKYLPYFEGVHLQMSYVSFVRFLLDQQYM